MVRLAVLALALAAAGGAAAGEIRSFEDNTRYLTPRRAEVAVRDSVRLNVSAARCIDPGDGGPIDICTRGPSTATDIEWRVNGVAGGSATLGTIHGGALATYTAPARVPAENPVSISAVMSSPGGQQLQLVSEVEVFAPAEWKGNIAYQFSGQLDDRAPEQALFSHFDQVMFWLAPEHEPGVSDVTRVSLSASYAVRGTMMDAVGDDGEGVAVLTLGLPTTSYLYERRQVDACLGVEQTRRTARLDVDAHRAAPMTVNVQFGADGRSSLSHVPAPVLVAEGLRWFAPCNDEPHGEPLAEEPLVPDAPVGMALSSDGTVSRDFTGRSADRRGYEGNVELPATMRFHGQDIPGLLTVTWRLARVTP